MDEFKNALKEIVIQANLGDPRAKEIIESIKKAHSSQVEKEEAEGNS